MSGQPKNFAISFAPSAEGQAITAWAGWVHAGEIENGGSIAQPSVEDAFAFMEAQLSLGDFVDNLWVYSHGDPDGFLHAPKTSNKSPSQFDEQTAQAFIASSVSAPKFHKYCVPDTKIHAYACNAGKADALVAARLLFAGGASGKVCGPNGWYHTHVTSRTAVEATALPDAKSGCSTVPFFVDPETADDVAKALKDFAEAMAADPTCFSDDSAKRTLAAVKKLVDERYDDFFVSWFKMLDAGGQVPKHIRGANPKKQKQRSAILAEMWNLWEASWPVMDGVGHWLATPFIAARVLQWEDQRGFSVRGLQKAKRLKAVFPDSKKWKKSFKSKPKKAGFSC